MRGSRGNRHCCFRQDTREGPPDWVSLEQDPNKAREGGLKEKGNKGSQVGMFLGFKELQEDWSGRNEGQWKEVRTERSG